MFSVTLHIIKLQCIPNTRHERFIATEMYCCYYDVNKETRNVIGIAVLLRFYGDQTQTSDRRRRMAMFSASSVITVQRGFLTGGPWKGFRESVNWEKTYYFVEFLPVYIGPQLSLDSQRCP